MKHVVKKIAERTYFVYLVGKKDVEVYIGQKQTQSEADVYGRAAVKALS